jgi:hypothetical protein
LEPLRLTKQPEVSILTGRTAPEPCVDVVGRPKFVGVIGSSSEDDFTVISEPCAPRISRLSDSSQLMVSTGPDRWCD